jgi:phenylalanyl-tRNA synthetase beta chain
MKVSLRWLSDYVNIALPPDELAHRLTMAGVEVETIQRIGAEWDREKVLVSQVTALAPHPNADRLQLVTVDYGRDTITVVTGAFNLAVGDKVPLALAGARVRNEHSGHWEWVTLKPGKIRGVLSEGMVCSPRELDLGQDHLGILILDADAPVGTPLVDYLGDAILDLEIKGRWDCLCLLGVAREVNAIQQVQLGQPDSLRLPPDDYPEEATGVNDLVRIDIADPDLCPRYSATVLRGVKIGPSPRWLQERLLAVGLRPINNIVDVTNYVMWEWNQPLHAFDYDKIRGQRIIVRRAGEWNSFCTLDGQGRDLTPEMLMIADAEGPVAVAGVMGGLESEVTEATTNILLESANFHPVSIRHTARALHIPSEAQRRFEKGLAPEQTVPAVRRATRLMLELAGGTAARGVADAYPCPPQRLPILLPVAEVERLLGLEYSLAEIGRVCDALGFQWQICNLQSAIITPHYQRTDVAIPADLVEEVARLEGYDQIPATLLAGRPPEPDLNPPRRWEELCRDVLVAAGCSEILTYPLTSQEALARLAVDATNDEGPAAEIARRLLDVSTSPLALANPPSPESSVLRTSTVPALLDTLARNLRHQDRDVALFELGTCFLPRQADPSGSSPSEPALNRSPDPERSEGEGAVKGQSLPEERKVLAVACGQYRRGPTWGSREEVDFFQFKGLAEELLARLGIAGVTYQPAAYPVFHPGRCAVVAVREMVSKGKRESPALPAPIHSIGCDVSGPVGIMGEVHPTVRQRFELGERVWLLALDLERLLPLASDERQHVPLPKFPPVVQDIAVVVDIGVPAARVAETVRQAAGGILADLSLFDVYQGEPIPAGKKSLAYSLTYQAPDRTLTDEEVARTRERIVQRLAKELGVTLRA